MHRIHATGVFPCLPDVLCREAVGYTTGGFPKTSGIILIYDFSNFPTTNFGGFVFNKSGV